MLQFRSETYRCQKNRTQLPQFGSTLGSFLSGAAMPRVVFPKCGDLPESTCVSALQAVHPERIFSNACKVVGPKRAGLKPDKVNMLDFWPKIFRCAAV